MTSREKLKATLNHQQPDGICVDFGATAVTGMHVSIISQLHKELLGDSNYRVKVIEPYQMLGDIDEQLTDALGIDVAGASGSKNIFGFENNNWKPFILFDGTKVLVPGDFYITKDENENLLIYPQGDTTAPPCAKMPKGGAFFDTIIRQPALDEDNLNVSDNLEEFTLLSAAEIKHFAVTVNKINKDTDKGIVLTLPGTAIGDVALVPAPFLKHPRGIRDIQEWYLSTAIRQDYLHEIFSRQTEIAVENIIRLSQAVGDGVQAAFVCGTDFGTQRGLFCSRDTYRELYSPYYQRINAAIHEHTPWKTLKHSCGSVVELIPDFIDDGFDILNPVQCSADNMDPDKLKREFGDDIVFWGGGVDTQKTLPFGSPEDVYREVIERIDILGKNGGFVFNAIHNVQANTPIENILAMFKAIKDFSG